MVSNAQKHNIFNGAFILVQSSQLGRQRQLAAVQYQHQKAGSRGDTDVLLDLIVASVYSRHVSGGIPPPGN